MSWMNESNATGNYTEHEQPLYQCEHCNGEFTATYELLGSELCWDCNQEFRA
tara:strand:+ start:103 stop:258 length:156 start_codon:yes stop_codon:yes gene_type:complete